MTQHPILDLLAVIITITTLITVVRILRKPSRGYKPEPATYPGPCTYCGGTVKFQGARKGWKCRRCGRGLPGIFEYLCR